MIDPLGNIGYWKWLHAKWKPPADVETMYNEVDIALDVTVSFPNPRSEVKTWNERRCKPRYGLFEWDC